MCSKLQAYLSSEDWWFLPAVFILDLAVTAGLCLFLDKGEKLYRRRLGRRDASAHRATHPCCTPERDCLSQLVGARPQGILPARFQLWMVTFPPSQKRLSKAKGKQWFLFTDKISMRHIGSQYIKGDLPKSVAPLLTPQTQNPVRGTGHWVLTAPHSGKRLLPTVGETGWQTALVGEIGEGYCTPRVIQSQRCISPWADVRFLGEGSQGEVLMDLAH